MVVPIPKTGDSRCIENYRGITLLSTVGKAFMTTELETSEVAGSTEHPSERASRV